MRDRTPNIARQQAPAAGAIPSLAPVCLLVASALAATACKPKDIETTQPALGADAPTLHQIVAAQNERAARLATTWSDGVIELRWTDEDGEHTEQGDLELWQTTGNRTAARISKLGEELLWLGSKDQQWWLFDLMKKGNRILHMGTHDQVAEQLAGLGVRPLSLLDLLGITAITPAQSGDAAPPAAPTFDATRRAWMIAGRGLGGPLRAYFTQHDRVPVRIELLDESGRLVAASELSRYESIPVPNTAIMARPKFPRTIDIRLEAVSEGDFEGDVKIALNQTAGEIDPKQAERIFDLDRLVAALRPDRVQQASAGP